MVPPSYPKPPHLVLRKPTRHSVTDDVCGDLAALNDGRLPDNEDDPEANFFFAAGSSGWRFRIDRSLIDFAQVNTYSWHPNTRGPQVYNLYASDGAGPGLDLTPDGRTDPARAGWELIVAVDTRTKWGNAGGQYGVSVSSSAKESLGRFRYLLFNVIPTETDDPFGNTFYSEVDVITKKQ